MSEENFTELSPQFFIRPEFKHAFEKLGLTSTEAVFSFTGGKDLAKTNLARHRSRIQFNIELPATTLFLKRYDGPSAWKQLSNWLRHHSRRCTMFYDLTAAIELAENRINTPRTVCYGWQWGCFFEKRSFIVTEKIVNSESLERKLPECFARPSNAENLRQRRKFIAELAAFARVFHETGYCHSDFYFAHIFYSDNGTFHVIDLQRAFKPLLLRYRFRIKDIAQLYYSAAGSVFSRTDRLRFYFNYRHINKLGRKDKRFIRKVVSKVNRMARHDRKHGRAIPFAN